MKPKQKKQKKPLNKWKLTAIISLVVNGLVAILLAIGLTQPKTQKTSALGTGGDYYVYENSYNIDSSVFSWNVGNLKDLNWSWVSYNESIQSYVGTIFISNFGADYLSEDFYVDRAEVQFTYTDSVIDDYWLSRIYLYPYGSEDLWNKVYECVWNSSVSVLTPSYYPLGIDNPYAFISTGLDNSIISFFNSIFINRGTNEVIYDFNIQPNWSPNKYISLVTDSVGLLYDAPSVISGPMINRLHGVSWSNPIYRGDNKSQLGYLEIPLLFTSHGENYIGIRLYYDVVMNYVDKNNEIQTFSYGSSSNLHDFHYTFVYMSYVYELSNSLGSAKYSWKEKVVCALPIYRSLTSYIEDDIWVRNFIYEVYQPYNWLHEDYKSIGVYEASTPYLNRVGFSEPMNTRSLAINNMTIRQILEFDMTQNDYGINTNGYVNIGNVFVLISNAFSSVLPLLSVVIVPGITIGMLVFIPLVLTIIIVVIKLVKR